MLDIKITNAKTRKQEKNWWRSELKTERSQPLRHL